MGSLFKGLASEDTGSSQFLPCNIQLKLQYQNKQKTHLLDLVQMRWWQLTEESQGGTPSAIPLGLPRIKVGFSQRKAERCHQKKGVCQAYQN